MPVTLQLIAVQRCAVPFWRLLISPLVWSQLTQGLKKYYFTVSGKDGKGYTCYCSTDLCNSAWTEKTYSENEILNNTQSTLFLEDQKETANIKDNRTQVIY